MGGIAVESASSPPYPMPRSDRIGTQSRPDTAFLPELPLIKPVRLNVRIHSRTHPFERADEPFTHAGEVAGQAVVVAHIVDRDPEIQPVDRRKGRDGHAEVVPLFAVLRFSAKALNLEVLGIVAAVVPADGNRACRVGGDGRLEVVMSVAKLW